MKQVINGSLLMCMAIFGSVTQAAAEELTGTLKKINDSGAIIVGYRESNVPFSYNDGTGQAVGYSQEYSNSIIAAIKAKLGKPDLAVKYISITSPNRIPLLQNGVYDFECGSTTNNPERQKQVTFSDTIFVVGTRLLTNKNSGIKDFPDLAGKPVTTTGGTTSEALLNNLNTNKNMNMRIISAQEGGSSAFNTLESGRAVAFMMDDALLAGDRAKARHPSDWQIVGTPQSKEAYGCMIRKGDEQFRDVVNKTISDAQTSGQAAKWFQRWFAQPIPPKGLNLAFELSDDMKALFAHPNDRAL